MSTLQVFVKPLCCSSRVCGLDVARRANHSKAFGRRTASDKRKDYGLTAGAMLRSTL